MMTSTLEEILIAEVMKRRPLWDCSTSRAERHQAKLKALWEEIVNIFEGKVGIEYLKKKWRQLRDEYIRARRKEKTYVPSGSGAEASTSKPAFRYYEVMQFLNDDLNLEPTESNIKLSNVLSPTGSETFKQETPKTKKSKQEPINLEKEILEALRDHPVRQPDAVDGFLLMLGDSLRRLPFRNRSILQIAMLTMAQNELDDLQIE